MADVVILLACALIVLAGLGAVALIARSGHRRRVEAERDRPARLRRTLAETDDYIRRVRQATTDEQLDRLDDERKF